ncbi:PAS domain-containing sensor histidine kinase [Natronomonas salina]|uniref:sensor histidine kinase n=1 Tax=Natronomonas salina TaxID=1710540 RepID=UPI0015B40FEE|nr:PAS domain-containing sensor histidine kinase [Natronomonas salina]QLD91117.1 PAS domain-containing sensor histidine kinase [Natronomonas salina]
MGRSASGLPVGPLLAVAGVGALAVAGHRAYVAETIEPILALSLAPLVLAGGVLLALAYLVRSVPDGRGRVLLWTAVAGVAVGATADATLLRTRVYDAPLDPLLVIAAVGSVGAAAGAVAGFFETRRRNEIADLRARATRAERTIETAGGFAVARLDPEGYVDGWSDGAEAILGYSAADVVGTRIDVVYPEGDDREAKQHLQRALRTDHVDLEGEFVRADGETLYGSGSLTAVESEDGDLLGYLFVLADRSEERARREELERRNEQLEAFASIVSHDLRNPLNVAIGNVGMAKQLDDDAEKLETAESSLERMERLIEEVLTLAREGEDVEEFERVELAETVQLAWSSVDQMWAELEVDDLPAITAEGERVRRLFENLFRNAIEHGGGDVTVRVGMLGDEGFYVEDDGEGIPKHKRDEVFDAGHTTGEDGTGLGLAIVQSIAEAHGWEIEAVEGSDGGARFEVRGVQTLAEVEQ